MTGEITSLTIPDQKHGRVAVSGSIRLSDGGAIEFTVPPLPADAALDVAETKMTEAVQRHMRGGAS